MAGIDTGAESELHLLGQAFIPPVFYGQQNSGNHAQIVEDAGPGIAYFLPPAAGMKSIKLNKAAAAHEHGHEGTGHGIHMAHGQWREKSLPLRGELAKTTLVDIPLAHHQEVLVGQQTAFGHAGAAGGVKDRNFILDSSLPLLAPAYARRHFLIHNRHRNGTARELAQGVTDQRQMAGQRDH